MSASNLIRLRRELTAAERIPYTAHVHRTVLRTRSGHYVQSFRLGGASFECADDAEINNWHERLNVLWRNIASPNIALWTHVLRRRDHSYPDGQFRPGFADELNTRYRRLLAGETLMVNELYLSLVYRPTPNAAQALTLKALMRSDPRTEQLELAASLESCAKLSQIVAAALTRYGPEPLGIYSDSPKGRIGSSLLEFLGALINSEQLPMSVPRAPLNETLATSRLLFGTEVLEYRMATHSRLGAMLGIKEYASPTKPGLLNRLLAVPFPLVLSQSFTFLSKGAGQSLLQRQYHRLTNAGDFSHSQAEELHLALDALTSNSFVMGDHHLTLQIQSELIDHTEPSQLTAQLKLLNERIAIARSALADTGLAVAREDLALEAAFWAQLPHMPRFTITQPVAPTATTGEKH
jgi:type IV secretion system protein VirB4